MKIILASYGTRGDLQPLLALALGLKSHGHTVTITAQPDDAQWIDSYDCPFIPLGSRLKEFYESLGVLSLRNLPKLNSMILFLRNEIVQQFSHLLEICHGADLILATGAVYAVPSIAEHLDIPYCFVSLCPQAIPSNAHAFWAFPFMNLPPILNRLTWRIGDFFTDLFLKKTIDRMRGNMGLTPSKGGWDYLLGHRFIVSTDSILGTVPDDVNIDYVQLGYLHLNQKGELPAELEKFLNSGPPPIYIGFGSMSGQNSSDIMQTFLNAAQRSGHRLILTDKWRSLDNQELHQNCFFVGNVPHPLLFSRLAGVVHHGGAGTTATAARAGVPQIVIPHFWDQFYWANRVYVNGLGPHPIGRAHITDDNISSAFLTCTNRGILDKVRTISEILTAQNSLSDTIKYIEHTFT